LPFRSPQDHNKEQSGGGRDLQEEAVYRILYSLRYPIVAITITLLAVISVVVSLTGPDDENELVEAFSADLAIGDITIPEAHNVLPQIQEDPKPFSSGAIDIEKTQNDYRETLRLEAVSGDLYMPNFVPEGNLISSITSFTPAQTRPVIQQPANPEIGQPIQPSPDETVNPPSTFNPAVEQWRNTVRTAIISYGGPASDTNRFLRIMQCESMGQPDVTNATSGAAGLMQHMPQYWDQRAISAGYAGYSPYDAVANINVSAWLIYQASGGGWQHWVCQ